MLNILRTVCMIGLFHRDCIMNKIILISFLYVGMGVSAADRKVADTELTKDFCALNADINGYLKWHRAKLFIVELSK